MTVASINTTVTSVVTEELGSYASSNYSEAIARVSDALAEREYAITEAIVEAAANKYGVSKHEVTEVLRGAGLSVRPAPVVVPEPVVEAPAAEETVTADDVAKGKLSKGERIAKLEEGQAAILSSLNALTELAKRHLGANL